MKRAVFILMMALAVPAWLAAQTTVDERHAADPNGVVEIENMVGSIKVVGWDQAEVRVTGTVAPGAELEFDVEGKDTEIEVDIDDHDHIGVGSDLEVHVPAGSLVEIEGVQLEIEVSGVTGSVEAETVNGGIALSGGSGEVSLQSVNGAVTVSGPAGRIGVEVVNGAVTIEDVSGELEASTVNGELIVTGGPFTRVGLESVAGRIRFDATLALTGRLDVETVSAAAEIVVPADIKADFSITTFSGDIENDLGIGTVTQEEFIPAKELSFSTGTGGAEISVETLSGTVHIRKQ